jgi:hypothetical protein
MMLVCRSAASAVSYSTETKFTKYPGNVDDAIKYLALNGAEARGAQAKAARETECCPMALSRAIAALKACEQWEAHVESIRAAAAPAAATAAAAPTGAPKELDMATPRTLRSQIVSGTDRLGDGRPYGSHGNSWGEYREGHKIGSTAVAAVGVVTRANAAKAAARLKEAGVHVSETTLYTAAKEAPGVTANRMGAKPKIPDSLVKQLRDVVVEIRELGAPELKSMLIAEINARIRGTAAGRRVPERDHPRSVLQLARSIGSIYRSHEAS